MIVSIIYLIISLLLEVIMSNFFQTTLNSISIFTTIYTIIALVIIYPYFNNERKYFILVVASGLLFDILYTSSFIFNLVLFLIVGIVIKTLYSILSENIFITNIISIIAISTYHIAAFIILSILSSINYNLLLLINIIIKSILMTIIYTTISYYSIKFVMNKLGIKQIK